MRKRVMVATSVGHHDGQFYHLSLLSSSSFLDSSLPFSDLFSSEAHLLPPSFLHLTDVYMSLVATLESLLLPPSSKSSSSSSTPPPSSSSSSDLDDASSSPIRVYGRGLRFDLGPHVLSKLGVYTSPSVLYRTEEALEDVDAGWGGLGADAVVLPTVELE